MDMYTIYLNLPHSDTTVPSGSPIKPAAQSAAVVQHMHKQHRTCCHGCVQVGLQGVDNGAMRFTNVRIPRDNLLDRFATVDRGGKYSSPYSPSRRFAATLGELTGGRVGLTCGSLGVLKVLCMPCLLVHN